MPSANSAAGIGYAGRRAIVVAGLILIFAPLAVQYFFKARDDRSAFLRWRPQILDIGRVDVYERYTYPNPPIMALILWPLAQLPPLVGSFAWFAIKLLMAGVALNWIVLIVQGRDHPFPAAAKLLVAHDNGKEPWRRLGPSGCRLEADPRHIAQSLAIPVENRRTPRQQRLTPLQLCA